MYSSKALVMLRYLVYYLQLLLNLTFDGLLIFQIKALIDKMDGRVFLYMVIEKLMKVKKKSQ